MAKCVHCGEETELGLIRPDGSRDYPLFYPRGSRVSGYVDLLTTTDQNLCGPGNVRLTISQPMLEAGYLLLSVPMLRQMIQDIENA